MSKIKVINNQPKKLVTKAAWNNIVRSIIDKSQFSAQDIKVWMEERFEIGTKEDIDAQTRLEAKRLGLLLEEEEEF